MANNMINKQKINLTKTMANNMINKQKIRTHAILPYSKLVNASITTTVQHSFDFFTANAILRLLHDGNYLQAQFGLWKR
jgi:predicted metallo-beta-lactamase superfamily hydrolase